MDTGTKQTTRIVVVSFITIIFAVILVKILLTYVRLDLLDLFSNVLNLPIWLIAFATVAMLLNIMLGAQNWHLTVRHVSRSPGPGYLFYLTYTVMSAIFGLFIPIQISNLIIRSISLRFWGNASTQKSTVTALISQLHDVTIAIIFLIPGTLVVFGKVGLYQWLLYEIALIAGAYFLFGGYTLAVVKKICSLQFKNKIAQKIIGLLKEGLNVGLFDNSLMISLYKNSLAKFMILSLRVYIVSRVLGLNASLLEIVSIFSALQLSIVFTITPGNLGVTEWGWVGLLVYLGVTRYAAGNFALTLRLLGYATTVLVFTIVFSLSLVGRTFRKKFKARDSLP